ncbi:uncharacterized protein OCT59_016015 [Rhizophagus irregularis]|uniref:Uncharacterized protein n=1 Tax=Rhizophagus irregularis (strain DAOM 181602 / DAOM 197198 / MUCL 43194) TaxID=747089 RepID=U9UQW5_RHIID|nr:hypothetical protein OCT59_016015 [Rhizophagus irregularis]GBC30896.1 hypothetical protein GLOIN_2v1783331 [Rhizophagus irregularis DAOM 181602=DAOM 197198]
MSNLNRDVLYMIFEQLQNDKNTLYSCLLVNKTWCEIIIPILWRNPWESLKKENEVLLLSVIISHLSNVSKNEIGKYKLLINFYKKPSFNYIRFCRYLNLNDIQRIINNLYKEFSLIVLDEVLSLFINDNMKFTHLFVHQKFDKINPICGAESCFSGIEYLSCSTNINDTILTELIKTCKSIKELELIIRARKNNYGIVKLIEAQKKLFNVNLVSFSKYDLFCDILENLLITMQIPYNILRYYGRKF